MKLMVSLYSQPDSLRSNSYMIPTMPNPSGEKMNSNPATYSKSFSISTDILSLPSQRFKHPRRQLVPNQSRKHHQVLGFLEQLIGKHLAHWVVKLASEEVLTLARAAADTPKEHAANVACNLHRVSSEAVGC
jgi:hypothetical protein